MNTLKRKEKCKLIVQKFGRLKISPKKKLSWTKYKTQVYKMYTKINSIISKFTKKGIIFMV